MTVGSTRVEYLPVIRWGRRTGDQSAAWKLTPARGGTLDEVADAAPALAAALGVSVVLVEQATPSHGTLEVRW